MFSLMIVPLIPGQSPWRLNWRLLERVIKAKQLPSELDSDFAITSVAPTSTLCGGEKDDKEEEIGLRSDDDEKLSENEDSEPVKIFTKTYGLLIFWFVTCNVFILIKFAFFNMWLNWYFDGDQAQAERNDLLSSATELSPAT